METKDAKTTDTSDRVISAKRIFDSSRDVVWEAWTDPDHIGKWWGPTGFTTTTETMESRPNGVWRFVMHGPDGRDYRNKIVYIEVKKPERLVYRHAGEGDDESVKFHVTVTFTEQGSKTMVDMKMVFESAEELQRVDREYGAVEGLNQTMNRLKEYLAKR